LAGIKSPILLARSDTRQGVGVVLEHRFFYLLTMQSEKGYKQAIRDL